MVEPESSALSRVLHRLREWPLAEQQIFEDLANVLGNRAPAVHEFGELERRVGVTVRQLAYRLWDRLATPAGYGAGPEGRPLVLRSTARQIPAYSVTFARWVHPWPVSAMPPNERVN